MDDRLVREWCYFLLKRHLDRMLATVDELGDELLNVVPDLPGANSPYQILIHCCGMLEWWTREANLGIDVGRDRDAEFVTVGDLATLRARAAQVRAQLLEDLPRMELTAAARGAIDREDAGTPLGQTQHGVLLHVLEELAQHHGHLDLTVDLLRR